MTKYNVPTDNELSPSTSRIKRGAMTLPSLRIQSGEIYEEARKELRYPYCIPIYKEMVLEPTIASALSLMEILISRAEWKAVVPKKAPKEEFERAEYINWMLCNMERGWQEYIIEILSYLQWGFQPMEKIFRKVEKGKHKGRMALKDLRPISPDTISKWIYNLETEELAGLRQDLSRITSDFKRVALQKKNKSLYIDIPRKKFLLFRYNAKLDNPQGTSPLRSCYIPWKQKITVEDYELIAISKTFGGVPLMGVDVDFLAKASEDGSNEQQVLQEMDRQAASFTAGEQAFVRMPIAYNESGKELFTFKLLESTGSNTTASDAIISRNENKMLMCFLADVLKLGTESHGSYALADSKSSLLSMGVEHHLKLIKNVLNHDMIKQLYALNGWEYDDENSVKLAYGDIEKQDLEVVSKFVQRVKSVGAIRATKDLEDRLFTLLDIDPSDEADMDFIETESTSRAGKSNGTSGYGNNIQDNSDSNSDNSA